jgi:hypothetical protein
LIVLGTHGHNPIDRMFFGSTAEPVLRHARCPVLAVRADAESTTIERADGLQQSGSQRVSGGLLARPQSCRPPV